MVLDRRAGRALLAGALALGLGIAAPWAQEAPPEDPLDLVALLVRDGQWERAATALGEVEDAGSRGLDRTRFHTLRGLIAAHDERWDEAATDFAAAITAAGEGKRPAPPEPTLYLQLAQAQLRAGRAAEAVATLDAAPEAVLGLASTWLLKAQAAWAGKDAQGSWSALAAGAARFPDNLDFARQQILLLVQLGLYQEAGEQGAALLARADAKVEDVLVIAEALKRGGGLERAGNLLGQGRLRFPGEVATWVQSAALAIALDRPAEAAGYLQVAAELDPSFAFEAAEVWRRAGDLGQAMRLNAEVVDPVKKARQRLGLLVDQGAWDQVVALESRADRLGLVDESPVAYGLAYARFRTGDDAGAERMLQRITDPKGFQLATELRGAMAACREDPGACP